MSKIALFFALASSMFSLHASDVETVVKKNGALSSDQLSHFQKLFGLRTFIETGTYCGDTTSEASKIFPQVHSIEIFEPLYLKAQNRFANQPNITLYLGDTTKLLHQMIDHTLPKRLYWLDAHSSGGGTGGIPGFSPIIDELDQILVQKKDIDSVILIDDLRGMCHCDARGNLPLRLIIQKLDEVNAFANSDLIFYSVGDIGIIYNQNSHPNISVSEIVKYSSVSRFFDQDCNDESQLESLLQAESFIASYQNDTPECIKFRQLINWVDRDGLGGEVIYLVWEALRELEAKHYTSAIHDFELIANSFYSHWRMEAYLAKALALDNQVDRAVSLTNDLLKAYPQHSKLIQKIVNL
jgi:hypothetical protein